VTRWTQLAAERILGIPNVQCTGAHRSPAQIDNSRPVSAGVGVAPNPYPLGTEAWRYTEEKDERARIVWSLELGSYGEGGMSFYRRHVLPHLCISRCGSKNRPTEI